MRRQFRGNEAIEQHYLAGGISCPLTEQISNILAGCTIEPLKNRPARIGICAFLRLGECCATVDLGGKLGRPGIMSLDQNIPAVDEARTPVRLPDRSLSKRALVLRFGFAFRVGKKNLLGLFSKDLVLDVTERVVVLILFLYF